MALYVINYTGVIANGMEEVTGSIPVRSTNQINNLDRPSPRPLDVCVVARRSRCLAAKNSVYARDLPSNANHGSLPMTF
jgi:hypothetical protein